MSLRNHHYKKTSGGDGNPVELFQILKEDAVKYASKFGKLSSGRRTGKDQFSFQSQRKATPKNVQTTKQLHSYHMLASESESEVAQSCPTLSDPVDCSLPGSSIHGVFQARVLEWVAIAFSLLAK